MSPGRPLSWGRLLAIGSVSGTVLGAVSIVITIATGGYWPQFAQSSLVVFVAIIVSGALGLIVGTASVTVARLIAQSLAATVRARWVAAVCVAATISGLVTFAYYTATPYAFEQSAAGFWFSVVLGTVSGLGSTASAFKGVRKTESRPCTKGRCRRCGTC